MHERLHELTAQLITDTASQESKSMLESITCTITGQIFRDPITLPSGNAIERAAAKRITSDPFSRQPFTYSDDIPSNRSLIRIIDAYLEAHPNLENDRYSNEESQSRSIAVPVPLQVTRPPIYSERVEQSAEDYNSCPVVIGGSMIGSGACAGIIGGLIASSEGCSSAVLFGGYLGASLSGVGALLCGIGLYCGRRQAIVETDIENTNVPRM